MALAYSIRNQHGLHFITCTTHQWVDVFTRNVYKDILMESIEYCQINKGLKVYAWVLMSNHIHMIVSADDGNLSDVIRDFKKYTSRMLFNAITKNPQESRKDWMLWLLRKDEKTIFWQEGYHGEEVMSKKFFDSKAEYIHQNPVKAGIVEKEEEYLYSSAGDYYGERKGFLEITFDD